MWQRRKKGVILAEALLAFMIYTCVLVILVSMVAVLGRAQTRLEDVRENESRYEWQLVNEGGSDVCLEKVLRS